MHRQLRTVLAVAAFALSLSAFTSAAHATPFTLRVDNYLNPSAYAGAKTVGWVRVSVWFINRTTERIVYFDSISGQHDITFDFDSQSADTIRTIHFTLEETMPQSQDLLIIDQVELIQSGVVVDSWGIDNEAGYCISWDADDGANSHCHDGRASPGRTFTR